MTKTAKEVATFRLSQENKDKLKKMAEVQDRTVSYLVNLAVREFLERRSKVVETPTTKGNLL